MVSKRKRKKDAAKQGLSEPELQLLELLEEILEKFRWLQVLLHAQSFLLREKLKIGDDELDRVLAAATRAVEEDARLHRWEEGLARLKGEIIGARRAVRRERKRLTRSRGNAAAGAAD